METEYFKKLTCPPGPVIVRGCQFWHDEQGRRHRDDGPAVIRPDGTMEYLRHGRWHRAGGPAIVRPNGANEYYLDGKRVTRQEAMAAGPAPAHNYQVTWSIDVAAAGPAEAASKVWADIFGRGPAGHEDACVFHVADTGTGETTLVDLAEHQNGDDGC